MTLTDDEKEFAEYTADKFADKVKTLWETLSTQRPENHTADESQPDESNKTEPPLDTPASVQNLTPEPVTENTGKPEIQVTEEAPLPPEPPKKSVMFFRRDREKNPAE